MLLSLADNLSGDCKDEDGLKGRCVAGAINNYTNQLLTYNSATSQAECKSILTRNYAFVLPLPLYLFYFLFHKRSV